MGKPHTVSRRCILPGDRCPGSGRRQWHRSRFGRRLGHLPTRLTHGNAVADGTSHKGFTFMTSNIKGFQIQQVVLAYVEDLYSHQIVGYTLLSVKDLSQQASTGLASPDHASLSGCMPEVLRIDSRTLRKAFVELSIRIHGRDGPGCASSPTPRRDTVTKPAMNEPRPSRSARPAARLGSRSCPVEEKRRVHR